MSTADDSRAATISVAAVDWQGQLRAKPLAAADFELACARGMALTSAIYATDAAERPMHNSRFQDPANGYRDGWLRPEPATRYAGIDGQPLVLGAMEGEMAAYCPRALLARELTALRELGYLARGAYEYEFHLLRETPASLQRRTPQQLRRLPGLTRMYSWVDQSLLETLLEALRSAARTGGAPVESLHTEFTGLLEAALAVSEGMAIADRAVVFKALAKAVARRHGLLAVFMARLADGFETAGGHLNLSLWTPEGSPVFHAGSGVSPHCRWFVAGLQRYTPELTLLHLPNLNSYKRYAGTSFAPRANAWGLDNKTCAWRVVNVQPELTRIECRLPGADVPPHLALAAVLAAGRQGLEARLEPTAGVTGDAAVSAARGVPFPPDFEAALAAWRGSALARTVFGEAFVDAWAASRQWQLDEWRCAVTDWDLRQYAEGV